MLNGAVAAGSDSLRSGRLSHRGVVVVWGDFPQGRYEEDNVVYVRGDELDSLLSELPERFNPPQRAAIVVALQEARAERL